MSLEMHLLSHVILSLFSGFIIWWVWRRPMVAFSGAILGGILMDLDHFIDYFIAFGFSLFNLEHFTDGAYGTQSGRLFYFFHGWEYVVMLLIIGICAQKKVRLRSFFLAMGLSMLFHLMLDVTINKGMTFASYSITYRAVHHFRLEDIITPEQYQKDFMEDSGSKN